LSAGAASLSRDISASSQTNRPANVEPNRVALAIPIARTPGASDDGLAASGHIGSDIGLGGSSHVDEGWEELNASVAAVMVREPAGRVATGDEGGPAVAEDEEDVDGEGWEEARRAA
jgi:hypothetical protein